MDTIDTDILAFMRDRENYETYHKVIHKGLCTKESWTLLGDFGRYFEEYPEVQEIDKDFFLWFRVTAHPGWKEENHKLYGHIISNVTAIPPPARTVFVEQLERLRFEHGLQQGLEHIRTGRSSIDDVLSEIERTKSRDLQRGTSTYEFTLNDLAANQRSADGLYWRCEDLNKSIGPIRTGDFTIIGKRPEVGGTSFLCSEMSHMLEQLPDGATAVIFNNEEAPDKVATRMMSSALGVDYRALMMNPKQHQAGYEAWLSKRQWKLAHETSMDIGYIHHVLKELQPSLIGINILAKIGGTDRKEDHDKLESLGQEFRRIAQDYGPVLAVAQADPSAEGMRYIPQDRLYKSKTALQGEADILLMIGHDDDGPPDSRYLHVAKNKIPPAPCCDLTLKHIKSEVHFDIGSGRFLSKTFSGNSRNASRRSN